MEHINRKLSRFGLNDMSTTAATFAARIWNDTTTESYSMNDVNSGKDEVDEINRFSRTLLTFAAVITILIMIVGICGNMLTIIALLKCPKVRNVAAAFIISLCIADCIFCAIVLPFSAFRFIQGTWTHGAFLCRLIPFVQYGNVGVSLLCIAMITINRYIMIAHHSMYARIYKKIWIGFMLAFCWLFSYGMQLPTLFEVWGAFGYDSKLGTCSILRDNHGRSSKTALFIIAFVIPCLIIVGCYARIFWVVHESEVRLRRHASKQNSIPNNLRSMPSTTAVGASRTELSSSSYEVTSAADVTKQSNASQKSIRVKDQRDVKARRNEWRITKMVLAIFLSFIACYLPITVIKVTDPDVHMPTFHIFGYIMLYLSACINPIIYVIMNKQYRQAYKTVLMCRSTRLLPKGSSLGEKWKDIGYSYNHSRTVVSQVSIVDSSSNSISQPTTMREPINSPHATTSNINNHINRQSWTANIDTIPDPAIAPNQVTTNHNNNNTVPLKPSNLQVSSQLDSQRAYVPARISYPPPLDLGDVIIEEDETIPDDSEPKDIPASIRVDKDTLATSKASDKK